MLFPIKSQFKAKMSLLKVFLNIRFAEQRSEGATTPSNTRKQSSQDKTEGSILDAWITNREAEILTAV